MAGGDVTKTDHILYDESYLNLVLYGAAMPRHDDVEPAKQAPEHRVQDDKKMNFSQFLSRMAEIKTKYEGTGR